MTYTDAQACEALGLTMRAFQTAKSRLHVIRHLTHQGLHGRQVDDDDLQVLQIAAVLKQSGLRSWAAAISAALKQSTDAANPSIKDILLKLMDGDGSTDERAYVILSTAYARYNTFLEEVTLFVDFLHQSVSAELANTLKGAIDTCAKAAAFEMQHAAQV